MSLSTQAVITVRLSRARHEQLKAQAHRDQMSLNQLCVLALNETLDPELRNNDGALSQPREPETIRHINGKSYVETGRLMTVYSGHVEAAEEIQKLHRTIIDQDRLFCELLATLQQADQIAKDLVGNNKAAATPVSGGVES